MIIIVVRFGSNVESRSAEITECLISSKSCLEIYGESTLAVSDVVRAVCDLGTSVFWLFSVESEMVLVSLLVMLTTVASEPELFSAGDEFNKLEDDVISIPNCSNASTMILAQSNKFL